MITARKCASTAPVFSFNFALWPQIEAGASLASAALSCSPAGLTFGTVTVSGTKASLAIGGGTKGTTYLVDCHATFSDGQTDCQQIELYVY